MHKLWKEKQARNQGNAEFFLIALSHENLVSYFNINFILMEEYKYSLTELEAMIPWERDIYLNLLSEHLKTKEEMRKAEISKLK